MLELTRVTVRFGDTTVLDAVDLSVERGETLVVLGPSGCGKSTLLRGVAGLEPLDAGEVRWNGDDISRMPAHERRFGLMFQEYALFPHRDVAGNVEFGLRMHGADRATRAARVGEVLDLVGLGELRTRRVAGLSGGEQQRVALARALAVEPRLLMLDEPLGALDRAWRDRLLVEIRALLERTQLPAIYVTHDQDEAFALATEIAVMRAGRIVQRGTPRSVWERPADAWTADFLGFGPAHSCAVGEHDVQTPWGPLPAPANTPAGRYDLVLRPDALSLDPCGVLAARVERATFAGERVDLLLQPPAGPALALAAPRHSSPEAGECVRLAVDPAALLLYPRD